MKREVKSKGAEGSGGAGHFARAVGVFSQEAPAAVTQSCHDDTTKNRQKHVSKEKPQWEGSRLVLLPCITGNFFSKR